MKIKKTVKKTPNARKKASRRSKATREPRNRCYCSKNPDFFKSHDVNYEEILQIPGVSDVSLMGNDSPSKIQSSKLLLAGLGPKFRQMLQHSNIQLDYPLEVVQTIQDFTQSGVCNFNLINLRALLLAAKEFNIIGIRTQATHYLVASTNICNAHESYQLSMEKLLCTHTRNKIKQFILENFEELGQKEDFLQNCKSIWMKEFIKDETLNASEESVFKILLNWAQQSKENELVLLKEIAGDIRFELMDQHFFNDVVKTCPFLQESSAVQAAERLVKNRKSNAVRLRPRKDRSRVPNELVFAVGKNANIQIFNTRINKWNNHKGSVCPADNFNQSEFVGAVALNGKLVVIGGSIVDLHRRAYSLDLSDQTWTSSVKQFGGSYSSAVVELGGKVYCIGGSSNIVEYFDPNTNQWTKVKPMIKERWHACAIAYDNKIFVLGGLGWDDLGDTIVSHHSIEIYDPELDEWTLGPRMTQPRQYHKAVVLNDRIYAIGGRNGNAFVKSVENLDLLNPNAIWKPTSEMLTQKYFFGATVLNKKIMVTGTDFSTEMFSDETNEWTLHPQPMGLERNVVNAPLGLHLSLVTVKGLPNRKKYLSQ